MLRLRKRCPWFSLYALNIDQFLFSSSLPQTLQRAQVYATTSLPGPDVDPQESKIHIPCTHPMNQFTHPKPNSQRTPKQRTPIPQLRQLLIRAHFLNLRPQTAYPASH
jgi:hypothetical protein